MYTYKFCWKNSQQVNYRKSSQGVRNKPKHRPNGEPKKNIPTKTIRGRSTSKQMVALFSENLIVTVPLEKLKTFN